MELAVSLHPYLLQHRRGDYRRRCRCDQWEYQCDLRPCLHLLAYDGRGAQVPSGEPASLLHHCYQDEHLLRADVDYPKILRQIENGLPLLSLNASEFDLAFPTPSTMGDSTIETYLGRNVGTYETGTVQLPASSRTLTGSSTVWTTARGVGRGTKMRIGDAVFTVNTVDSDTQITLYEANGTTAVAAGTAYAAIIDNPIVLLHPIPDTVVNYYYRFQRVPAVMDRDGDIPDLPHALHHLLVEETQVWAYIYKGLQDQAQASRTRYESDLVDAIRSFGHSNPDRTYRKHSFDEELRSVSSRHPILNAG